MNNVLPVDGKFKNRGLNRYKYSKIKVENEDAQPIDAEFENEGLNKYAYEDIDSEEELFVYAPNMAAAKIQMQLLFGEDDGIYLYRENAYSKPLTNVETGEDIYPSDLYFTYSGLLKSGEIKQTFQEYINQQIDDGILETKGKKKKKKEGASKVKENKRPESEATNVGSIGQFKRGGIRPGAPMDQDDYEKWSEQEDGSTQNEDHFDEDESTTPKFEEDQGVMVRKFKDKDGNFGYYMSKDGGETWFPTEVQKFGGDTNTYSTTTSSTDVVTEADDKTQGVVDYVKDGVKDDLKNGVENVKSVVGKGENQKTDDEQEADEKAKEGNENTENKDDNQDDDNTEVIDAVKRITADEVGSRANKFGANEVFKGKRDYNVVFAKGISEEQAQQFVDALSDFYVYPQKPPQGSNNRYQFLISSSSTNPISNSATESRITKRICRANKLNELNIKKEGTEEYILYKQINDKSCAKSIYEAYIKDSGDDALCTYWETNKLIDTPKIKKEGKKVMRRNVNENSNPKYVSRPAIIKFIKRKYRDKNYTTEQIEDLLDEKGVEYFDIGYRWVGHPNEYERCDSEPDCKKEGKKVMRNNRRRVNEKNMMLRGRRVTENYGLGMSLNLLKDMTGIADTDELLAKIDEFVLFNDCDPIFDESCRDQFVDYCNNGGDDFGCEECGDFGGDNFGGELSDEAFDNFGEEDGEGEEPTFDEAIDLGDFDFDDDDEIVEDEGDEDEGDDIKAGLDDEDEGDEEKKEESYRRRSNLSSQTELFGKKKKERERIAALQTSFAEKRKEREKRKAQDPENYEALDLMLSKVEDDCDDHGIREENRWMYYEAIIEDFNKKHGTDFVPDDFSLPFYDPPRNKSESYRRNNRSRKNESCEKGKKIIADKIEKLEDAASDRGLSEKDINRAVCNYIKQYNDENDTDFRPEDFGYRSEKSESYRRNNRSRKNEWFLPYDAGKRISDYARTHRDEFDELSDEEYDSLWDDDDELSDEAFDNFGLDDECPECRREINPIPPVFAKESCGKKKPTKKGGKKSVKESKYHWTNGASQIGNTDIYYIWHGAWIDPEYAWYHNDKETGDIVVDWYNGFDVQDFVEGGREDGYGPDETDYEVAVQELTPTYRTDKYGKEIGTFDSYDEFVPNYDDDDDDDDYFESYKRRGSRKTEAQELPKHPYPRYRRWIVTDTDGKKHDIRGEDEDAVRRAAEKQGIDVDRISYDARETDREIDNLRWNPNSDPRDILNLRGSPYGSVNVKSTGWSTKVGGERPRYDANGRWTGERRPEPKGTQPRDDLYDVNGRKTRR